MWLGRVERAWAAWTKAVLLPPKGRSGGEAPGEVEAARAAVAAAGALQRELAALRDGVGRGVGGDFRRSLEVLAATVAVAGTFVAATPAPAPPVHDDEELARSWDDWARQAAARLQLHRGLLAMRTAADAIGGRLIGHWKETVQGVDAVLDQIKAALNDGVKRAGALPEVDAGLRRALATEQERTARTLGRPIDTLNDPAPFLQDLARHAEAAVEDLESMHLQLPEVTLHDLPDAGEAIRRPGNDSRVVETRELAVQAFDTLRMERIRTAPSVIAEALDGVGTAVRELGVVSDYGYEAALGELADGATIDPGHARILVTDGLSRAGNGLAAARAELRAGLEAAADRVSGEVGEGAEHLVQRVTADRLTAGYLDARSYLATEVAQDWKQWRGRVAESGRRAWEGIRAIGRRFGGLLSVLGFRPQPTRTSERTENTLASAAEFVRTLPVVYQRLFAFAPLTDAQFLAGRDDELAEIEASWARWKDGGPGCLVVITPPGTGVTSFLNVVSMRLSDEAPDGARRVLRERCREEASLAGRIAPRLGLDGTETLDDLAKGVTASPDGSIPRLVIFEGIEHFHMRAPGGGRLFRRFMTFVSRTESRIFWILSIDFVRVAARPYACARDGGRNEAAGAAAPVSGRIATGNHLPSPAQRAAPAVRRAAHRSGRPAHQGAPHAHNRPATAADREGLLRTPPPGIAGVDPPGALPLAALRGLHDGGRQPPRAPAGAPESPHRHARPDAELRPEGHPRPRNADRERVLRGPADIGRGVRAHAPVP